MAGCDILFLGKRDDEPARRACAFLRRGGATVTELYGAWGEALPAAARAWRGDYVISYLSRWVVPEAVLAAARRAAINFHPAPPEYPGIGCCNLALYEDARAYGVTCHHMAARVDTGAIITCERFPLFPADDVASLLTRTYVVLEALFYRIAGDLLRGAELPTSAERWTRAPITRAEFEALCTIDASMPADEIARRVRATDYGRFRPTLELGGYTFALTGPADPPPGP